MLEDYAEFLAYVGRTDEALKVTRRGFALDPNLLPLAMAHMEALISNGHLDEALATVNRITLENQGDRWLWLANLFIFLAQDDYTPDEEFIGKLGIPDEMYPAVTAIFKDRTNETAIEQLKPWYSEGYIIRPDFDRNVYLARGILAWAGASDHVLDVDIAMLSRNPHGLEEWAWSPLFKSIRQNPRYAEYLELTGLIEYWDANSWPEWCQRTENGRIECK